MPREMRPAPGGRLFLIKARAGSKKSPRLRKDPRGAREIRMPDFLLPPNEEMSGVGVLAGRVTEATEGEMRLAEAPKTRESSA